VSIPAVDPPTLDTSAKGRLGSCLGGWTLQELIGMGGMAAVYRATSAAGEVGAVKVMHRHLAGHAEWVRRLRREADLLLALEHPGLVRLLERKALDDGTPFLVMELLDGGTLEALRKASAGALPLTDVLDHAREVLDVLAYTHARGIVHRDLKPSNVFVTTRGALKVLDFGIASHPALAGGDATLASATRGILGTPAYMAPEQARGRWEFVDHRSDLWAVGAMIFTLASGQFVHVAVTENERLGLAMTRRARPLASVLPGVDGRVASVVDRALAYDTRDRFQSASDFRVALEAALAGRWRDAGSCPADATVRDLSSEAGGRSGFQRVGSLSATLAVLGLGGLALFAALPRSAAPVRSPASGPALRHREPIPPTRIASAEATARAPLSSASVPRTPGTLPRADTGVRTASAKPSPRPAQSDPAGRAPRATNPRAANTPIRVSNAEGQEPERERRRDFAEDLMDRRE
jgi:serine/threonine-protein kinase